MLIAQAYFKASTQSEKYFNHQIQHFSNGDILIGDSSIEPLNLGQVFGEIVLSRLDQCGFELWSFEYEVEGGYVELKDVVINSSNEVFVYGSYYFSLQEQIFLMKVDGNTGIEKEFRLFNPGTVDHFTYSIDLKDDQIMIYGLLQDFDGIREGFIALLNDRLNVLWSKKFTPFDKIGGAIMTSDNGFLGRSANRFFKLNANAEVEWASALESNIELILVSGPIEVSDGFILEASADGGGFFLKISKQGQLIWTSDQFPASVFGSAMSLLPDGKLLCTYSNSASAASNPNVPVQLMLSQNGTISKMRILDIEQELNISTIYQSIHTDNTIAIAGNFNASSLSEAEVKDFILQFTLSDLPEEEDCYWWSSFPTNTPNFIDLELIAYSFVPTDFDLVLEKQLRSDTSSFSLPFREICSPPINPELLEIDTFVACGENWTIALPDDDFEWIDGTIDDPRIVSVQGIYQARRKSCIDPLIASYRLQKEDCGCPVFLPNAFSPNNDGVNDRLEFFSECNIEKIEVNIFNRWGELIFQSSDVDQAWDGMHRQKELPNGVYIAMIKYNWIDPEGVLQEGVLAQAVTLIR